MYSNFRLKESRWVLKLYYLSLLFFPMYIQILSLYQEDEIDAILKLNNLTQQLQNLTHLEIDSPASSVRFTISILQQLSMLETLTFNNMTIYYPDDYNDVEDFLERGGAPLMNCRLKHLNIQMLTDKGEEYYSVSDDKNRAVMNMSVYLAVEQTNRVLQLLIQSCPALETFYLHGLVDPWIAVDGT